MQLAAIKTQRLYLQVAEQITDLVRKGAIKPSGRLPAERVLADELGVSRPTVREAMIALEIAGIIEIKTGLFEFIGLTLAFIEVRLPETAAKSCM